MKYGDFRVYRTTDRSEADGDYIIQLPPGLINPEERYVAVVHRTSGSGQRVPRSALARIVGSERLEAGTCRLDQTIRARIGVKAEHELDEKEKEYLVEVHRVLEPKRTGLFQEILAEAIRPRKLMLTLKRSAEVDAEKNIAITAPENVNLLGVGEGDHIMASTVVWDSDEKVFRTDQASFKVVGRTEYEVAEKSRVREELNMREILRVDVVGRQQLGVAGWEQDGASFYDIDFEQGHPVVI